MTKKKKTTMSVPEMQRLLGLGKTDRNLSSVSVLL